jgi:hypothetical protein
VGEVLPRKFILVVVQQMNLKNELYSVFYDVIVITVYYADLLVINEAEIIEIKNWVYSLIN